MTILILANNDSGLYGFRRELIETLVEQTYQVIVCVPSGQYMDRLRSLGCEVVSCDLLDRHGTNPFKELQLLNFYKQLLRRVQPDIVFTYTIKPNVYGGMMCTKLHIPYVVNITGLGTAVENDGWMQKLTLFLYKMGVRKAQKVFFQNKDNQEYMLKHGVVKGAYGLLPGSGVNLKRFPLHEYPQGDTIKFLFISRIMKEKGIEQYLEMARYIRQKYPDTEFHVCGYCEKEYQGRLQDFIKQNIVIYHGEIHQVSDFLKDIHCLVHPTYYPEGTSNVLLEACASGRPIITTDRAGCREVVDDGVNGYMIPQRDVKCLIAAVERFLSLTWDEKRNMGIAARKKVEQYYDRRIVVDNYLQEVQAVANRI